MMNLPLFSVGPARRINPVSKQDVKAVVLMNTCMAIKVYLNDSPPAVGKGRASRRQLRLPLHGSKATGAEIEGLVHNISATGMLVESDAEFDVGEMIEVNLPHSGKTAARVIWTSARLIGCQFDMPISPATLSAAQLRSVVVESDVPPPGAGVVSASETFGSRLQRLRVARELTQGQLAAQLGVSEPSISAWELDKARPKVGRMEALSEALGVEISELLGIDGTEPLGTLIARAKQQIARAAGVGVDRVRVTIEI